VASDSTNARRREPQAFNHKIVHFTFTDKRIGAG
jgi:hypothetical protein